LPPANYYDNAIGPTGAALKSALHGIIDGHIFADVSFSARIP
jgi:hypothetical protein